jgi:polyisoprenoid-binding protein YceI
VTVHVPLLGTSQVHGTTPAITGQVEMGTIGGVDTMTAAQVSVDLRELSSGNTVLDQQVALVLQTDLYPMSEFRLTQPASLPLGGSLTSGAQVTLHGDLTLQGISRPVDLPATVTLTPSGLQVVGSVDFLLSSYGVSNQIAGGLATVDDVATFEFSLLLVR